MKKTDNSIRVFQEKLVLEEKSAATIEKYLRDVRAFFAFLGTNEITKEEVLAYKKHLDQMGYAVRSINSMLASINKYLELAELHECKVKSLRVQKQIYSEEKKELTKKEYMRLLTASKKKPQLHLILQTICGTGIRVSELKYFTVEAVKRGEVHVNCKAKVRCILIPGKLRKLLLAYTRKMSISEGPIFITKNKNPLDRSNIWASMKKLCQKAKVNPDKVFPHNLRKLFAKTFYRMEKDIAKLADILGHGSIETTRIYIMTSGYEHRKKLEKLRLVM